MRSKKTFLVIFFILLNLNVLYAIDTNAVKYFPLRVGNYWVYNHWWQYNGSNTRFSLKVMDTLIANGHKYYRILRNPSGESYQRLDSTRNNLRQYVTSNSCTWLVNEQAKDSLSARYRDSAKFTMWDCNFYSRCIDDSSYVTIFGMTKRQKVFNWDDGFEHIDIRAFARDIGLVSDYFYGPAGTWTRDDLRGCIINGILYGDTSLTGINIISTEVPGDFKLFQNYPNPFNPKTVVRFQLPAAGFTKLIIYDFLGKEVAVLVNESLNPGTYEVEWDASNFPSGVYFYRLIAGEYTETKKMVLTK